MGIIGADIIYNIMGNIKDELDENDITESGEALLESPEGVILNDKVNGVMYMFDDDIEYKPELFAVTISIYPFHKYNNKFFNRYTKEQQTSIYNRWDKQLRYKTPSIELLAVYYEESPNLVNHMHSHALYKMPPEFVAEMETYYYNKLSMDKWEHPLVIEHVYDREGWVNYITKHINKE